MEKNHLEIQKIISKAENYNRHILKYFSPFFGKKIIEIGCGFGHMTERLLEKNKVCCVDISKEFVSSVKKRFHGNKHFSVLHCDAASKKFLSLKKRGFDTIICFNVLEHIKQDDTALKNFFSVLPKGGRLLLLVPAFGFLFGSMDIADNHFRRYSKKLLTERLKAAGFHIEKMRFQNFFGVFGWFFNGKILKRKIIPEKQLLFFDRLVPFLFAFEKIFGPPFGQSLLCVARKPL